MATSRLSPWARAGLLALILLATWLYTWGLPRNLPYSAEADENIFVERTVMMFSRGDGNPGWFGNPGSTIFYPLLAIYQLLDLGRDATTPDLATWFAREPWLFYLLARLLSVAYTLLTLPLLYQIGRRVFNPTTGLIGVALFLSYPTVLFHIKSVRTDGVALFFATLSVWACLQLAQQPTIRPSGAGIRAEIGAGISIGLGIASRYFLVLFAPLLLWLSWRTGRARQATWKAQVFALLASLLAIGVGFALSTPYFFLDFPTAWHNLVTEGRSTHPGADGLPPLQNLRWYFVQIARSEYQAIQTGFGLIGLLAIIWQRRLLPLSLVGMIVLFLAGISASPLHWLRWVIPILPLAALVSAYGLVTSVELLGHAPTLRRTLLIGLTLAAMAQPSLRSIQLSVQDANPNTRLAARLWLLDQLPAQARLIQEPYTALLADDPRVTTLAQSLGTQQTLADYHCEGYTHLMISSAMYQRFLAEPARYPTEVAFYQTLLQAHTPLISFAPTWSRGGPTLHLYALDMLPEQPCPRVYCVDKQCGSRYNTNRDFPAHPFTRTQSM